MMKGIVIGVGSTLLAALLLFAVGNSINFFEKKLTDTQIAALAHNIANDSDIRKVILDEMQKTGQFQGPEGARGPHGMHGMPKGLVSFFRLSDCPEGWVADDYVRGRYIIGVNLLGELGATVGAVLSDKENRATGEHTHAYKDHYTQHNPRDRYNGLKGAVWSKDGNPGFGKISMTTDSAGSVVGTNAPYIQLLPCKKI